MAAWSWPLYHEGDVEGWGSEGQHRWINEVGMSQAQRHSTSPVLGVSLAAHGIETASSATPAYDFEGGDGLDQSAR